MARLFYRLMKIFIDCSADVLEGLAVDVGVLVYFVTACTAWARYSTFLLVTPAIEMRPSLVRYTLNSLVMRSHCRGREKRLVILKLTDRVKCIEIHLICVLVRVSGQ